MAVFSAKSADRSNGTNAEGRANIADRNWGGDAGDADIDFLITIRKPLRNNGFKFCSKCARGGSYEGANIPFSPSALQAQSFCEYALSAGLSHR